MEEMNLIKWSKREIDLAVAKEASILSKDEKQKAEKCYEEAWFAYCDFLNHMELVDNPGIVKTIFMQLFNGDPLAPIEDNNEDWVVIEGFDPSHDKENPGWSIYQCKRRSTLFKKVTYDRKEGNVDKIKYSDAGRAVCIDVNTNNIYTGGIGPAILDEMMPIKMPYSPIGKIKIFTEEFKAYEDTGDFDTIGVLYFRLTNGQMKEVKRFFKEDYSTHQLVEIDKTEYLARKEKANKGGLK